MNGLDEIDRALEELNRRLIKLWSAYLRFVRLNVHTWCYS
jgi:hypothetical protein